MVRCLKLVFYFLPSSPKIITSAPQLPKINIPLPQNPQTKSPGGPNMIAENLSLACVNIMTTRHFDSK